MLARHAANLLRPCRGIRLDLVEIAGAVGIVQPAIETVVRKDQIIDADHAAFAAIRQRQGFDRQLMQHNGIVFNMAEMRIFLAAEIGEGHLVDCIMPPEQTQLQLSFHARRHAFQVPFSLLAPAKADRAVRHHQLARAVKRDGFPFRIISLAKPVQQIAGAQHPSRREIAFRSLLQQYQHRHIGIAAAVVDEILAGIIKMKLAQDHVAHCHGERAVGALFRCQPLVAQLRNF